MGAGEGSVTQVIGAFKDNANIDSNPRVLWERDFDLLVGVARARLRNDPGGAVGDEDVALGTFDVCAGGLPGGRFLDLADRDGLVRLLREEVDGDRSGLVLRCLGL